jgi:hypothetical protein
MNSYQLHSHTNTPNSRVQDAIDTARTFSKKAEALAQRFETLEKQYGFVYPAGKIIRQSAEAEQHHENTEPKERNELLQVLEGLLENFDRTVSRTERDAVSAREQLPDDDPVAKELDALRAEIRDLQQGSDKWRREETATLGVGPESVEVPSSFEANRVDGVQRFLDAVSRLLGEDTPNKPSPAATPLSSVLTTVRPSLERRVSEPRPAPSEQTPIRARDAQVEPQPVDEQQIRNEPWPTTREQFRQQFRYSPERFGTPERYARYLAVRLNTPQRINEFLENMFVYTTARDTGSSQRMINNGPGHREPDERWINPLEFLTTPNAQGELCGDCDDIALLFAYIAQLQGKQGFAFETSTSRYVSPNRIEGSGHAMAAWFESDGSLRIVDTTGIRGRTNATIQTIDRRPGETDEQLVERGYRESRTNPTPLDARTLYTVISLRNGDGVNLPGNLSLCRRHAELQPLFESGDYRGVLRIVEEEMNRDPSNLNLRLAKIQTLLLANAPRSEVTAVTSNLSGVGTHTSYNMYAVQMTRRALLQQSPQYIEEVAALTRHCNGGRDAVA